ncbi:MAG: ATPase, T2SS/T4P/T4SS family [Desulfomonilia bacterium]
MADKRRMGEVLVELGLIDEHRLRHALEVAQREKTKLGETLIRLAYLSEDQVLGILKNLTGVPVLDMSEGTIDRNSQTILPRDRMRDMKVIPLEVKNKSAVVAFADPLNYVIVENVKFVLNREVSPVMASQVQIDDILDHLDRFGYGVKALKLANVKRSISPVTIRDLNAGTILKLLDDPNCTDLHVSVGVAPSFRLGGVFRRSTMPIITPSIMDNIVNEVVPDDQKGLLKEKKEIEYTYIKQGLGRYRINVYYQKGGEVTIAARKLVEDIPSLESLGVPGSLTSLVDKRGLLLVCSARGNGKDTTIAALVDFINSTRSCNIITFEDPIEYIHRHKLSNVNQREIGMDTNNNLREVFDHVMKHDPDVLVITNMKDKYMMDTAVLAAQKGILVIAGMNAIDVFSAIEQTISTLRDDYLKGLFSRCLLAAFAQRLIWSGPAKKRVLIWESMFGTPRIQKYIRDDKVYYIKGQAPSLRSEYIPIEQSLAQAVKSGLIEYENIRAEPWVNQDTLKVLMER